MKQFKTTDLEDFLRKEGFTPTDCIDDTVSNFYTCWIHRGHTGPIRVPKKTILQGSQITQIFTGYLLLAKKFRETL